MAPRSVEQIEGLVEDPARPRLVPVDLVDDDDGAQAVFERLLRDETRLRHGAVNGIHQQQHAVDHGEHALDLAAEIGVARRVDDVDPEVAPGDRGVLRENGDAALALEGIRVHDALLQILAGIERAGLAEELIDERGLAMIDVRDDGDVAKFLRHSEVPGKPIIIELYMRVRRSFNRRRHSAGCNPG